MKNLTACLIFIAALLYTSCSSKGSSKGGACGAGQDNHNDIISIQNFTGSYVQFTGTISPNTIYYFYPAGTGKVQFFIGINQLNICTKEHLDVTFFVITTVETSPIPMKFFGEGYWAAFSDDLLLYNGPPDPNKAYQGTLSFGLKQAFGDGPGDVDFYVTVEFDTQGSFSADSAFFRKYIMDLRLLYVYDKFL